MRAGTRLRYDYIPSIPIQPSPLRPRSLRIVKTQLESEAGRSAKERTAVAKVQHFFSHAKTYIDRGRGIARKTKDILERVEHILKHADGNIKGEFEASRKRVQHLAKVHVV